MTVVDDRTMVDFIVAGVTYPLCGMARVVCPAAPDQLRMARPYNPGVIVSNPLVLAEFNQRHTTSLVGR